MSSTTLRAKIDTDIIGPYRPLAAGIEKHAVVGKVTIEKRSDGQLYVNGKKVSFYRPKSQLGSKSIRELWEGVDSKPVLSASVLDFLLAHQEFIPEDWKPDEDGKQTLIYFWGTIYRQSSGRLVVRLMYWKDGQWHRGHDWIDSTWCLLGDNKDVCVALAS